MSGQVHNAQAKFRVSEDILKRAEAAAQKQGMSLSEFFRAAVRNELRRHA